MCGDPVKNNGAVNGTVDGTVNRILKGNIKDVTSTKSTVLFYEISNFLRFPLFFDIGTAMFEIYMNMNSF